MSKLTATVEPFEGHFILTLNWYCESLGNATMEAKEIATRLEVASGKPTRLIDPCTLFYKECADNSWIQRDSVGWEAKIFYIGDGEILKKVAERIVH